MSISKQGLFKFYSVQDYYRIVWCTKYRKHLMTDEIKEGLEYQKKYVDSPLNLMHHDLGSFVVK